MLAGLLSFPVGSIRRGLGLVMLSIGMSWMCCGRCSAEPSIGRLMPPGGTRGTDVEVTISGGNLVAPEQIVFEDGVIKQLKLESVNDGQLKATLRIPADAPLGAHRFRIRTAKGLSQLRTFRVGSFPLILEAEADPAQKAARNDAPEAAQTIEIPSAGAVTVAGVVRNEDVDCYRVSLGAGQRISAAISGVRLDHTDFDPYIEIVDSRGFVLTASDDHPLLDQDALVSLIAPAAGDYFVRVRESAYAGNDNCHYLLSLGRFPTPFVAVPPGGAPGSTIEFEWLGDPAGPFRSSITLPEAFRRVDAGMVGLFEPRPERDGVAAAEGVPIRVTRLPIVQEAEPNDEPDVQQRVPAPAAIWGRMDKADDVDWVRIEAVKGTKWSVRGWGRRLGSPIDITLNAHRDNSKRERITGNDDAEGPDSAMTVTTPEEGSFLVRLSDHQHRGGEAFVWWLEVEPVEPGVTVSVPPSRTKSQDDLVPQVARGNRTALILNASRTDFAGDLIVRATDLPAGVQATIPPLQNGAPGGFVVFEAAADAALAASMSAFEVRDAANPQHLLGGLQQSTELVHGAPNREPWRTTTSSRMPIAVVEDAQVTIELVQPVVPLVKNGKMDLTVRIHRAEGFKGKVRLDFPFKPPGVGAASGVDVPADKAEVSYPINANGGAPTKTWQVIVTATVSPEGDAAKGRPRLRIASRPVDLTIAEPFVQLALEKTAAEQGQETAFVGKITVPTNFAGEAQAVLLGLPAKTESVPLTFTAGTTELSFPVKVAADAPPGRHANVVCEIQVPQAGTSVVHLMPATELRIDKPLPVSQAAAAPPKPATPQPATAKPPQLSRREQLRLQAKAIAATGEAGTEEPKP